MDAYVGKHVSAVIQPFFDSPGHGQTGGEHLEFGTRHSPVIIEVSGTTFGLEEYRLFTNAYHVHTRTEDYCIKNRFGVTCK